MTSPQERARALRFAHELLTEMNERDDVPRELQRQAGVTLRHFPAPNQISSLAKMPALMWWLEAEPDDTDAADASELERAVFQRPATNLSVWTVTYAIHDDDLASTMVAVCYAKDPRGARAIFAGRFGGPFAREAGVLPGLAINGVTAPAISSDAIATMKGLLERQAGFSYYARLDHDLPRQQEIL